MEMDFMEWIGETLRSFATVMMVVVFRVWFSAWKRIRPFIPD